MSSKKMSLKFQQINQNGKYEVKLFRYTVKLNNCQGFQYRSFRAWLEEVEACNISYLNTKIKAEEVALTYENTTTRKKPSLKRAIFKTYYKMFLLYGIALLIMAFLIR